MRSPGVKPFEGRSRPDGGLNVKFLPEGNSIESVCGSKESFPEKAMAVTTVGDARKFMVLLFPSFLDLKLRLKLDKIAAGSSAK